MTEIQILTVQSLRCLFLMEDDFIWTQKDHEINAVNNNKVEQLIEENVPSFQTLTKLFRFYMQQVTVHS